MNGDVDLLWALEDGPAYGSMDLLTVIAHELGHLLGLEHDDSHDHGLDLMDATLEAGVRRLPTASDIDLLLTGEGLNQTLIGDAM